MNENVEKREAIINPEILPEKLSVIIKDEDGKLYESTKDNLRQKGYKIKELEFKKFINSDTDIQRQVEDIADRIITSFTSFIAHGNEQLLTRRSGMVTIIK